MKQVYVSLALLIMVFTLLLSCKTTKTLQVLHRNENIKPLKPRQLFDSVAMHQFHFKTLLIKFSADYETDKNTSFDGTLRIAYDSAMWISIMPMLGIEAARIMLTPDSVKFINQLNNTYYAGNYDYLNDVFDFDIDFFDIQAVMINEFFIYPSSHNEIKTLKHYKTSIADGFYNLQSESQRKIDRKLKRSLRKPGLEVLVQNMFIQPETFKIQKITLIDFISKRKMNLDYSEFRELNNKIFPYKLNVGLIVNEKQMKIGISYNKVIVNKEISFPFVISEKYTKISKEK